MHAYGTTPHSIVLSVLHVLYVLGNYGVIYTAYYAAYVFSGLFLGPFVAFIYRTVEAGK